MKKIMFLIFLSVLVLGCGHRNIEFRLLYWNIQNGMWDGQSDNYDRFVNWVQQQDPDLCVWCEGQSIWLTDSDGVMDKTDRYLVEGWPELASRYGHSFVYVGGHRDDYPQVITSKYPINNVQRLLGCEPDSLVCHGAGWATIDVNGKLINIVTLHTWPHAHAYGAIDKESSRKENGGDKFRRKEIEYICKHTVLTSKNPSDEFWLMMGDYNSKSIVDNFQYHFPEDTTAFLVHDYIRNETPYLDVVAEIHPGNFRKSMPDDNRIDFVYLTSALYEKVVAADVVYDQYTEPVLDLHNSCNFWRPSDHRPIIKESPMTCTV